MTLTSFEADSIVCEASGEPLWLGDEPTDYGVEVYTEGDCWALAWYLYLLAIEEGYDAEIFTLGALNNWGHVVVKLEGKYWDVTGGYSSEELSGGWGLPLMPLDEVYCQSFATYMEALDAHYLYLAGPTEAEAMARRVLGQITGWDYS